MDIVWNMSLQFPCVVQFKHNITWVQYIIVDAASYLYIIGGTGFISTEFLNIRET